MHIFTAADSKSKQSPRNIHELLQPFLPQKAYQYCVVAAASLAACFVSGSASALGLEDLQPVVRDAIKAHVFAKPGAPVPAFSWTLEKSRTMRKQHTVTETYAAAANGIASVKVADQSGSATPSVRERMSLRGLEYIDADDAELRLSAQDTAMPPRTGDTLNVTLKKDGESLTKTCKIGARTTASTLLASLPGEMAPIECTGNGKIKGFAVKTKSKLAWFDALGVFLLLSEEADTPLGKFTETVKIKQFAQ